jgi:exonuclease SbcC
MRLERLVLKGLSSAFPGVVDLPLRELEPGLIAIVGPNGKGKTTLLEATPGVLFRRLPSREGADPVEYALGRDSFIEEEFTIEGRGTFRARLNLDGPKRQSDAVLLAILPDGTPAALNDGKRSTFDAVIKDRFPSYDLFINSSFAAQGRGDEFTRRKPSQRKDLFVEFLGLQAYATMAAAAGEAAGLAGEARLRLSIQVEQLARDTTPALATELERLADELQAKAGQAALRRAELHATIKALEQRAATTQEQIAAYTTVRERVVMLQTHLASRRDERVAVGRLSAACAASSADELQRITKKRDADVDEADTRIASNHQIQALGDTIRAAVTTIAKIDLEVVRLRADLTERQAEQQQCEGTVRTLEKQIAELVPLEHQLARAQSDANLLLDVPCGGEGDYATCQFLLNATAGQGRILDLVTALRPKAALADALGRALNEARRLKAEVETVRGRIATLESQRQMEDTHAKYQTALAESTAKIAGYEELKAKAWRESPVQQETARRRYDDRRRELDGQGLTLDSAIAQVTEDLETAQAHLATASTNHTQAVLLQGELAAARRAWEQVIATLATLEAAAIKLVQDAQELASRRARRTDLAQRLAAVEQEQLEWRDLAKALGKGGLPDLEIDAAGPGISATANAILLECSGPRFSLELVTQTAKADGSGMKDDFTVRVFDNEGGGWRDISNLSGGEKVIVQEALMCAIALFVNERMPMPVRTLFRDETGAALDPENAIRYVKMLRKVRELGGYHHVLFISHNASAAALADAQIRVADGQAVIVYPPFLEAA